MLRFRLFLLAALGPLLVLLRLRLLLFLGPLLGRRLPPFRPLRLLLALLLLRLVRLVLFVRFVLFLLVVRASDRGSSRHGKRTHGKEHALESLRLHGSPL